MNKRNGSFGLNCLLWMLLCISGVAHAGPQLYETGPAEDSSFVRFVNASGSPVSITSAKKSAKLELGTGADGRASKFLQVKSGTELAATIEGKSGKVSVKIVGKAWEYITIAILPDGRTLKTALVRETPTDFNAMRASLALANLDAACAGANISGGAKHVTILDRVQPFTVQRRLVNPVRLTATVGCGNKSAGTVVDLSQLQAGGRYSVFLLGGKASPQAIFVNDAD